ncbi:TonB-dependent receptor plug [Gemmatirosa kalamazoonensis]|uniref:TonB-dependent receptor plug n=1 Tax=Gemmatirosa kalamazoonensis TaxID=861299 RepID=W0RJI3_9BACT|nr:carboxypeptidase regulatory-like domain-containing protein [Gemmatirosa kalamazoonensis]AHG89578.1 TonB-dependent receptor plug [Gemmatirosa kalamazoonensis]
MTSRRLLAAAACLLATRAAGAQGTIVGTVYDSLSRGPLRGAEVALDATNGVGVPRSVTTDASGGFRFDSVTAGEYALSFSHPTLDSLGIGVAPARVRVGSDTSALHLATPSLRTIARRACPGLEPDTAGMLVGRVRRTSDGAPVPARVAVQWSEWEPAGKSVTTRLHTIAVRTTDGGAYVACGVPNDVVVTVQALARSADSAAVEEGEVQVDLHDKVVTMQDLAVAPSLRAAAQSGARAAGTATLVLVVRDAEGKPVSTAHADVEGATAVADDSGAVRLARVPAGSRVATVRALGYEPATVSVTLPADASRTERVTLARSRVTLLGTVRVNAQRATLLDRTGFEFRRQAGFGQFVTAEQFEQRQAQHVSDVLKTIPGLRMKPLQNGIGYVPVSTRSPFGNSCVLSVFIDRMRQTMTDGMSIDDLVNPLDVRGIEVYLGAAEVPSEFRNSQSVCGAIIVWTRGFRP